MTKIKVRKGIRSYQGMSDYIYLALTLFFLVACGLAVFLPLLYVVRASFSSPSAIGNGRVYLLPVDLSLAGYTAVVTSSRVWLGFRNSVIYTVLGTTLNIAMTMLAAYPLSRKDHRAEWSIEASEERFYSDPTIYEARLEWETKRLSEYFPETMPSYFFFEGAELEE